MIADELEAAGLAPRRVGSLEEAVALAATLASPGDAVLLSPGCASFDAFDNFEHRGRVFRALVLALP
jgi:UDP-N-acetylmuramoylalanine--D-glutamate ligase